MPGFNQQQSAYSARNANTCLIMVGAQPIAFAQTTNHTFAFGTEGLYGTGNAKPQEIQQLKITPTITIDQINLSNNGLNLIQGGSTTPLSSLLANTQFNITVVDGVTGTTLFTYVGCVCETFAEAIASNQPISDTYTFMASDVWDSTGQSILNGPNALVI